MGNLACYNYQHVQDNVSRVYEWSMKMHMPLFISKCLVAHHEANNPQLQHTSGPYILPDIETFSDLGVK